MVNVHFIVHSRAIIDQLQKSSISTSRLQKSSISTSRLQVRDAGNLLTRAGLAIPAVDVDDIEVQYRLVLV